jgi:hypothetical protein
VEGVMLRFALVGFLSYRSRGLVGRPVDRIVVVLSRGSRVSNSIVSFGVRSNLCILALSFLVVFGSYPCGVLELVVISMTSSSSSKMDFGFITCCVFDIGDFPGFSY